MRVVLDHIRKSAAAFSGVARNKHLRWLQLAWAFAINGHWAYSIAVAVYAYKASGTAAVGIVYAVRLASAAFTAPLVGVLADRYRRETILLVSTLVRVVLMAIAAAAVYLDAAPIVIYVLVVVTAIATTPFRSSQAALTPSLANTPEELTAANAAASTVESVATFAGPAAAGLLLAVASTGVVFTINTLMLVVAAFFVARIWLGRREPAPTAAAAAEHESFFDRLFAGFRVIGRTRPLRVLTTILTAQTLMLGALQVYLVVVAFKLLDRGAAGVGVLNAAIGVGAIVGGVLMFALTGAKRFSVPFAIGVAFCGVPLVLIGLWSNFGFALLMFGVLGLANSATDVAGLTLVQRAVPDEFLGRVFSVIQMLWYLSLALGAALAPAVLHLIGIRAAIAVTGGFLVVLVAALWLPLAPIDDEVAPPDRALVHLLESVSIFAPLPGAPLEYLARRLAPLRVDAGEVIVREGDAGDRFYIVSEGSVEVSEYGRTISELGPGGYFGEIALIRDVPRTATVTAKTPVVLYALDRDDFLSAVTSHESSAEAAEEIVSARLAGIPIAGARVPTV